MWIGRKQMLDKINREDLHSHFPDMKFLSSVNDLSVVLDERLEMEEQIGGICRSGFYYISAPDQRHSPFLERRGSPVGSTGVHLVEGWLLQLRSPRIERHHGWSSAALDERGRSTYSEATKVLAHLGSDEEWSALASCPKADSVQDPADDMEVYFRKCPWLSPGTLLSPLHNTRTSSASIDGDKSLPARRTQGQDSYHAKEGFRPRGADIVEFNTRGTPLQGDELHLGYCQKTSKIISLCSFRIIPLFFFRSVNFPYCWQNWTK